MDRFWSLLFLAVPVMGLAIVLGAAWDVGVSGYWLPESIGPRTQGIDHLFNLIHIILGIVFLGTGLTLAFCMWRFRADNCETASPRKGQVVLELVWTIIPAATLIFLALYQLPYWQENKENQPIAFISDSDRDLFLPPTVRVVAFQYGWRFEYPGKDQQFDTSDDIISENILVLPAGRQLVAELVSEDVIHSFAINALRLKQDIVPGLKPRIWFEITEPGQWEINCTELCGWGHFRMSARLRVLSEEDFDFWQQDQVFDRGY